YADGAGPLPASPHAVSLPREGPMMRTILRSATLTLALAAAAVVPFGTAGAQSVNIDFGAPGSPPSAAYAAAGPAGVWNEIGVLPPGQRAPLVGLDGTSFGAQIY